MQGDQRQSWVDGCVREAYGGVRRKPVLALVWVAVACGFAIAGAWALVILSIGLQFFLSTGLVWQTFVAALISFVFLVWGLSGRLSKPPGDAPCADVRAVLVYLFTLLCCGLVLVQIASGVA